MTRTSRPSDFADRRPPIDRPDATIGPGPPDPPDGIEQSTASDRTVRLDGLRIGDLLAEGGEGRVFELPHQPHLVVKCYRRPAPREFLDDLVSWPDRISQPTLTQRLRAATAWPEATVVEGDRAGSGGPTGPGGSVAAGVLLPRAPRRFAVRHRDGTTRLATLSYLTADPVHRAVAYGLSLPEPVSPQRLGLVYALARLLEAFDTAEPVVGHGDLSTKNVLWSLQRGPEVFVLDCDNCERFDPDGRPLTPAGRRRAMTPNWDDPAVAAGNNPTRESDRYSLALIFLRVVGAANFPIQARQRQRQGGGPITVDFAVPASRFAEVLLGPGAPLWELCGRGLAVADPSRRPPATAWVAALEAVLDTLGAADVMRSVWAAQGGGVPAPAPRLEPAESPVEVVIRPVLASRRAAPRWTLVPSAVPGAPWRHPPAVPGPVGSGAASRPLANAGLAASVPGSWPPVGPVPVGPQPAGQVPVGQVPAASVPVHQVSITAQAGAYLHEAAAWWVAVHRHTLQALWAAGQRGDGLRRLAVCILVDLAVALVGLFVVGMIVSPVLGI